LKVFEKARNKTRDAALVREWIVATLPNFVTSADKSRSMWSLTLLFVGVSSSCEVASLLPYAQLRRKSSQIKELFVYAAVDFYASVSKNR